MLYINFVNIIYLLWLHSNNNNNEMPINAKN